MPQDSPDDKEKGSILHQDVEEVIQALHPLKPDEEAAAATAPPSPSSSSSLPFSKPRCIALVLTVTCAAFLNTLGVQAAIIILPTISTALSIPPSRQQWVISAYSLTFGCFLLLWGRIADVYGKRLIFIWGSAWLTGMSLLAPFVRSEIGFDVVRGLQGLGAAAMVPTAIGILGTVFGGGRARNYAFSCYGAGAPLGGIFGNLFSGVLGQYLEWRWIFWIFAMLAAAVTVAGYFVIPLPPPPPPEALPISMRRNVDWIGGTLVTVGLLILLFALTEGNVVGWSTPWVPVLIVVAVLMIALFAVWQAYLERRGENKPLMKVSIFKNMRFCAANIIMLLFFASFNNFLIYATYWFQGYEGLSVIQTTLRFIPTGVSGVIVAFITAHLLSLLPTRVILTFGTLSVSLSSLLFAVPLKDGTTYWAYGFPAMVLSVCGADTLYPTLTLYTAKSLPSEDQALGGALINAVGQVGRAIGLAIATAIQTAVIADKKGLDVEAIGGDGQHGLSPGDPALKAGLRSAAWFNFGIAVVALLIVQFFFRGAGKVGGKS